MLLLQPIAINYGQLVFKFFILHYGYVMCKACLFIDAVYNK